MISKSFEGHVARVRHSSLCKAVKVKRRGLRALALMGAVSWPVMAAAQTAAPPPPRPRIDANGIDLFAGTVSVDAPAMKLGSGAGQLDYHQSTRGTGWTDTLTAALDSYYGGNTVTVTIGTSSEIFNINGSTYTPQVTSASTLTLSNGILTYTMADGTIAHFSQAYAQGVPAYASKGRVTDVTRPSGEKIVYSYEGLTYCVFNKYYTTGGSCTVRGHAYRTTEVHNSYGWSIRYGYDTDASDFDPDTPANNEQIDAWQTPASVTGSNLENTNGSGSQNFQYTDANGQTTFTLVDSANNSTRYRMSGLQLLGITYPGAASENVTIGYANNRVSSVTRGGAVWTYSSSDPGDGSRIVQVTDPANATTVYTFDIATQQMRSMTDPQSHKSQWSFDPNTGLLITATAPEGNSATYGYDGRGNLLSTTLRSKDGGSTLVTTALYETDCSNALTCNQPIWTRDARGNQTDYAYDGTHGGLTSVTRPAGANGIRPQARYGYTSFTDYLGGTVWRLTSTSTCRTQSACSGSGDELATSVSYGSLANNLMPLTMSARAGDNSAIANASVNYDWQGNVIGSTDATGAQTSYSYDQMRRITSVVSPDPDGSGPLMRRARVIHYLPNGLADSISVGTVDANGGSFSSRQQLVSTFDVNMHKVQDALSSGGTTFSVTQYNYDAVGRPLCTAVRLDPGQWNGQSDPCTPQTSSGNGPDRVTRQVYDTDGNVTGVYSAYGTGVQAFEQTSYTPNGKVASVTDANGNVTTAGYDGFDRPQTTTFPGGTYEQRTFDANANVTQRRLRDGQVINYGYDALNQVISKDRPNNTYWETDQSFGYDNLGHLTGASDSNGRNLTFGYDALGRRTGRGDNWYAWGNGSDQYNAAGRRTRMTWNDGSFVSYDYLATGEMNTIRDSAGNILVSFGYDDLGRRTSLNRANGTSTTYGYDGASRLQGLNLSGGNQPNNLAFAFNAAGQITSRTASNDAYAWTGAYNVDRSYGVNALNQLTNAGATSLSYDGRGNLITSGSASYGYTVDNQLATTPGANLAFDPLGRLFNINAENGVNTTLTYDGVDVIAEQDQNSGALLRRYVYGPSADEPLIWYEGAGFGDRRWLHADERGSIVEVTNDAGSAIAINTFDEFGIPSANNLGRFQYTGQKWLPSVGLYDYKTRSYSPTLGRFMQADPTGYGDGMNWYNYVGADPINSKDPWGLAAVTCSDGAHFTDSEVQSYGSEVDPCEDHGGTAEIIVGGGGGGGGGYPGGGWGIGGAPADTSPGPQLGGYVPTPVTPMLPQPVPKKVDDNQCGLWAAVKKNGQAIIGDGIGFGASFLPGGKPAVALAGVALGAGILTNTAMTSSTERPGLSIASLSLGIAGIHIASAGPLAEGFKATSFVAKNLPGIGSIVAGGALLLDAVNVYQDYRSCQ